MAFLLVTLSNTLKLQDREGLRVSADFSTWGDDTLTGGRGVQRTCKADTKVIQSPCFRPDERRREPELGQYSWEEMDRDGEDG